MNKILHVFRMKWNDTKDIRIKFKECEAFYHNVPIYNMPYLENNH